VRPLHRSGSILLPTVQGASRSLLILLFSILFILTTNLYAILDTNQNGVSDLWEKKYNQGALYPTFTPTADPDGDGWTNLQEAAAGTDPANGKSPTGYVRPQITRTPAVYLSPAIPGDPPQLLTPEVATVTWPTVAGKKYTLLVSTDLTAASWTAIGDPEIGAGTDIGTSIPLTQPDGSTPAALFWRVTISDVDTDNDTLTNAEELELGTNPNSADTDGDGLSDKQELELGTSPNSSDSDSDGISDGEEIASGHDPKSNQSYPPRLNIALRTAHNGTSNRGRRYSNWPPYSSEEIFDRNIEISALAPILLATMPFPDQAPDNLLLPHRESVDFSGISPSYSLFYGNTSYGSLSQGRYWLQTKPASNVEIKRTFLKVTSSWRSTYSTVEEAFPPIVEKLEVTIPANSTASPHIDIMPTFNFPPGFYVRSAKAINLLPVEVKVVNRDDPSKTWTTGPITSGPVVYTSPTISEVSNGDLVSWGVPGLVSGSFEWWATGPNSSRKDGPTGAGKNEWKLINPLDWIPGKWRIHCRYTPTGGTVSEFDFEQKLGYRSPDITVLGWIDGTQITLPSGADYPNAYGSPGGIFPSPVTIGFHMGNTVSRGLFLAKIATGSPYTIPLTPDPARRYVNAHLIKNSANTSPPALFQTSWPGSSESKIIDNQALNAFFADKKLYRSFHRFQTKFELDDLGKIKGAPVVLKQNSAVGFTPIDIGIGTIQQEAETGIYEGYLNDKGVPIKFNPKNGKTHSAKLPVEFERYTQGRVSTALIHGGSVGKNLNNLEIPWIWSIPEFSAAHAIAGTIAVPEHEIFPVYHIYFNGKRIETLNSSISEAIIEQFIQLGETP
jgi:Bacterial TSP3 repeat